MEIRRIGVENRVHCEVARKQSKEKGAWQQAEQHSTLEKPFSRNELNYIFTEPLAQRTLCIIILIKLHLLLLI